ncbi:MAG: nuclease-related domain-containing protein [Pseudomonadota bacterium]
MPETLQNLLRAVPLSSDQLYLLLGVAAGIAALLYAARERLFNWREERRLKRALRRLGARALHDIALNDGTGGEVAIDHLLLTAEGVLVVGVKRFSGVIFGGPQTDQWTQVINRCSYKFPNPDDYLQRQIEAIRLLAPGITVSGIHLFTHGATFPKGKPLNVLLAREVRQQAPRLRRIPKPLRQAWNQLVRDLPGHAPASPEPR